MIASGAILKSKDIDCQQIVCAKQVVSHDIQTFRRRCSDSACCGLHVHRNRQHTMFAHVRQMHSSSADNCVGGPRKRQQRRRRHYGNGCCVQWEHRLHVRRKRVCRVIMDEPSVVIDGFEGRCGAIMIGSIKKRKGFFFTGALVRRGETVAG